MSDTPKSVWQGSFTIFGVELKCHVLDTGQRVIEADSMHALMEAMGTVQPTDLSKMDQVAKDLEDFNRWYAGKSK